jgi:hypothetical protein
MLQADEKRELPLVEEVEEEYDYEALPKNTSLTSNLMAGAFAGIMVCRSFRARTVWTGLRRHCLDVAGILLAGRQCGIAMQRTN